MKAGEPLSPPQSGATQGSRPIRPQAATKPRSGALARLSRVSGGVVGAVLGIVLLAAMVAGGVGLVAYQRFSADLPDVDGLRNYQPRVMSRVYAGDGRLLAELATERRLFVPYPAIPDLVKQAFVSAEDQNFWVHRGVDPLAIVRAGMTDLSQMGQGKRPVGASTITQQVAKNMLLDNQVSLSRKVKEAILAMRIEQTLSKERILELYVNEIYLGLGSYGVAAAAQTYFNKPIEQLTIAEAAFLAALPKAPNNYNPFRYPDAAKARRDWVLDRMADNRAITAEQAAAAKAEPIVPSEFRRPQPLPGADWFAEEVRRELITRFGADVTTEGGLQVRTSLDPGLQIAAEKALRDGLMAYDRKLGGWRGPVTHVDAAPLARDWTGPLGKLGHPPGMLPHWRLAVVTGTADGEARVGWLEPQAGGQPPRPTIGFVPLSDLGWARPVRDGRLGGTPRRITDVLIVGDVVMVEPAASAAGPVSAPPAKGVTAAATPSAGRVALRQIPFVQGALVAVDPTTSRVVAMVGGWSFEISQFNRATQAQRQPGSSFKPMVYLTAMEQGLSPSQKFLDGPIVVNTPEGPWRPANYEGSFKGPMPLRLALEESRNLVTVRVARHVGMEAVAQTAIAFHMVDSMPRVLPAALGAVDTTVLREAGAYAALAAGGREVVPTLIDSVQDRDGHVVWRPEGLGCAACSDQAPPQLTDDRKQIADPQSVFQLVTMMEGVVQHGTGTAAGAGMNRQIAGKTGTSQDFFDAWFSGFTPDLVASVWIGFDSPASLGDKETGGAIAAPVWRAFMTTALKNRPALTFQPPPGVTLAAWDTGAGQRTDAFKPDQVPGASASLPGESSGGTGVASESQEPSAQPVSGGVDTNMGGLY